MQNTVHRRLGATYICVNVIDVDDLQSVFHSFPVVSVIYGGHIGTLPLLGEANVAGLPSVGAHVNMLHTWFK